MKKWAVFFIFMFLAGFCSPEATAQQVCNMLEPGSLLVYPLIDNIHYKTVVEITNLGNTSVWLQGYMVVHPPGDPYNFVKRNFLIHLTPKEPFWWNTNQAYNRQDADGVITQIQAFDQKKGFMYVWAVSRDRGDVEIAWNFLKGDALVYGGPFGRAFQYHAIPHQSISVTGDRVLSLDGNEYAMPPSQVLVEGFAENYVANLDGKWVVCSLGDDSLRSDPPEFYINVSVWNQDETNQSRHLHFYQFEQYDLRDDLQLDINNIFTPKWQFAASSTEPFWSIFYQTVGPFAWGGNVWLNPDSGIPVILVLPTVADEESGEETALPDKNDDGKTTALVKEKIK